MYGVIFVKTRVNQYITDDGVIALKPTQNLSIIYNIEKYHYFRFFMYFWDFGLTNFLMRKYLPGTVHCRADQKPKGQSQSFKLVDLTSAFFLLGVGLCLSSLTFMLETFTGRYLSPLYNTKKKYSMTEMSVVFIL